MAVENFEVSLELHDSVFEKAKQGKVVVANSDVKSRAFDLTCIVLSFWKGFVC